VLIRWAHPTAGLLLPAKFINIFEKNGMILNLDRYVWERACQILRDWKEKGYEDYYLSVNISPKDIYLTDVCDILTSLVEKYEISPRNLRLEITETMIADTESSIELLKRLQAYGFIIEMDDFGSGYSSLNTLKNIPVDVLKLDLGFLRETHDKEKSEEILSFVVELSKRLNMGSIAEGIETDEQYEFLKNCGCECFQGYFFSQPIPIYEYEKVYIIDHKGF
jgi:EAL domain-containing protein (putative c-di-GMP-specific phosphodiesterase class I)